MSLFVKRDLRGRNADPTVWRYLHEAEAEIDRLQITLTAAQEREKAAESRCAALREALRPFANYACDEPHIDEPVCHNCIARAALAKEAKS